MSDNWKARQAALCPCHGVDDMCSCQNVELGRDGAARTDPRAWIMGMDDAPRDGTVIEACGRYPLSRAGFPVYVAWWDTWRTLGRDVGDVMVCWAWRPRTDWPGEPK